MNVFSSRNVSVSEVPAPVGDIWTLVSDAATLAELTPLVSSIDVDGEFWTWHLSGIEALGISVAPSFTEKMTFVEERSIVFGHQPKPGRKERAGAQGRYDLTPVGDQATRLKVDLTLHVELPLPKLSGAAVRKVMATTMTHTGKRFATNLYQRLGLDPATVRIRELKV